MKKMVRSLIWLQISIILIILMFVVFSVRKSGKKDQELLRWIDTKGSGSIPIFTDAPLETNTPRFVRCLSCVSESADSARIGSFVVLTDNVSYFVQCSKSGDEVSTNKEH